MNILKSSKLQPVDSSKTTFYSQFAEDAFLAGIFKQQATGVCVEVGAFDGVMYSNTFYFEKLGWQCVLVEPNPVACAAIRAKRTAMLFECAASDSNDVIKLTRADGAGEEAAYSTVSSNARELTRLLEKSTTISSVMVPTRTLDSILDEAKIARLDFISIDVEGHELAVLRGFDINRHKPRLLIIEENDRCSAPIIQNMLYQKGYVAFHATGCNTWYAQHNDELTFCRSAFVHDLLRRVRGNMLGRASLRAFVWLKSIASRVASYILFWLKS